MHKLYENEDITVFWDSERCRHAKRCVTGCPEVFDIQRRPWIDISKAENAKIWQTIQKCPTGALSIMYNHGVHVEYDEAGCRSVAYDGESEVGECVYMERSDGWHVVHTETNPAYRGKGIARRLLYRVLEQAEKRKIKVIPVCSYAKKELGDVE
ncbi:MAG: GNAT family N-acetyltransferase [Eubacterium sp.]|nr:GNAT family N-acetyltransferase [Eubacterium sp.]